MSTSEKKIKEEKGEREALLLIKLPYLENI